MGSTNGWTNVRVEKATEVDQTVQETKVEPFYIFTEKTVKISLDVESTLEDFSFKKKCKDETGT